MRSRPAAGIIRSNTHEALNELREVIDLLQGDHAGPGAPAADPGRTCLLCWRSPTVCGSRCDLRTSLRVRVVQVERGAGHPSAALSIASSRKSLTNVRKHAPQAHVRVDVHDVGDGIDVSGHATSRLMPLTPPTPPGSGHRAGRPP